VASFARHQRRNLVAPAGGFGAQSLPKRRVEVSASDASSQSSERDFYVSLCAILLLAATLVFVALDLLPSFGLIPR
jgi:hypothetical protein